MPFPNLAGRPKGVPNRLAQMQRDFAEKVCYGMERDAKGREDFILHVRKELFAGTLPAIIQQTLFFWLLGKPVDYVDVTVTKDEFVGLPLDQLRLKAKQLEQELADIEAGKDSMPDPDEDVIDVVAVPEQHRLTA